jgi:hypothetical protein
MLITHSGPPITWERICGPTRGAIMGALIYEGLAETPDAAAALAASGAIEFAPCHHYAAVGPMAGIISPSMPVFIVRNETTGHVAFATQNEGLGKVLRYGAYGPEVIPSAQVDGADSLSGAEGGVGGQRTNRPVQHGQPGAAHGRRVP